MRYNCPKPSRFFQQLILAVRQQWPDTWEPVNPDLVGSLVNPGLVGSLEIAVEGASDPVYLYSSGRSDATANTAIRLIVCVAFGATISGLIL